MKKSIKMDIHAYTELVKLVNNEQVTNKRGEKRDMNFLLDDEWVKDTAVIDHIAYKKGMWEVQLIFAHFQSPLKFIKRNIVRFSNKKKAEVSAVYMRRQAAKDARGTLAVDIADFQLCTS